MAIEQVRALAMANRNEHPVYDYVYALVSRRYAAPLASFDRCLLALCERVGIDVERQEAE